MPKKPLDVLTRALAQIEEAEENLRSSRALILELFREILVKEADHA